MGLPRLVWNDCMQKTYPEHGGNAPYSMVGFANGVLWFGEKGISVGFSFWFGPLVPVIPL